MVRVLISTGAGTAGARSMYECKNCGKTFKSQKKLQDHTKKAHGGKK